MPASLPDGSRVHQDGVNKEVSAHVPFQLERNSAEKIQEEGSPHEPSGFEVGQPDIAEFDRVTIPEGAKSPSSEDASSQGSNNSAGTLSEAEISTVPNSPPGSVSDTFITMGQKTPSPLLFSQSPASPASPVSVPENESQQAAFDKMFAEFAELKGEVKIQAAETKAQFERMFELFTTREDTQRVQNGHASMAITRVQEILGSLEVRIPVGELATMAGLQSAIDKTTRPIAAALLSNSEKNNKSNAETRSDMAKFVLEQEARFKGKLTTLTNGDREIVAAGARTAGTVLGHTTDLKKIADQVAIQNTQTEALSVFANDADSRLLTLERQVADGTTKSGNEDNKKEAFKAVSDLQRQFANVKRESGAGHQATQNDLRALGLRTTQLEAMADTL